MMHRKRIILLHAIAFGLICLTSRSAFSQSPNPNPTDGTTNPATEAVINAANKSMNEGDWAAAESNFREAMRLEPYQSLWRIQLALVLGHQKRWKDAFKEIHALARSGAFDWLLTINEKLPDGRVALVNTDIFRDEKNGILRYVRAVKEKKKVSSVAEDIGVKLDAFARQHKFSLMYDISKFKNMRFASGNTIDLTTDFIAYYNERHKD